MCNYTYGGFLKWGYLPRPSLLPEPSPAIGDKGDTLWDMM